MDSLHVGGGSSSSPLGSENLVNYTTSDFVSGEKPVFTDAGYKKMMDVAYRIREASMNDDQSNPEMLKLLSENVQVLSQVVTPTGTTVLELLLNDESRPLPGNLNYETLLTLIFTDPKTSKLQAAKALQSISHTALNTLFKRAMNEIVEISDREKAQESLHTIAERRIAHMCKGLEDKLDPTDNMGVFFSKETFKNQKSFLRALGADDGLVLAYVKRDYRNLDCSDLKALKNGKHFKAMNDALAPERRVTIEKEGYDIEDADLKEGKPQSGSSSISQRVSNLFSRVKGTTGQEEYYDE